MNNSLDLIASDVQLSPLVNKLIELNFTVQGPGIISSLNPIYTEHLLICLDKDRNQDTIKKLYSEFDSLVFLDPNICLISFQSNEYYIYLLNSVICLDSAAAQYVIATDSCDKIISPHTLSELENTNLFKINSFNINFLSFYYYFLLNSGFFTMTEREYVNLFSGINNICHSITIKDLVSDKYFDNKKKLLKIFYATK